MRGGPISIPASQTSVFKPWAKPHYRKYFLGERDSLTRRCPSGDDVTECSVAVPVLRPISSV